MAPQFIGAEMCHQLQSSITHHLCGHFLLKVFGPRNHVSCSVDRLERAAAQAIPRRAVAWMPHATGVRKNPSRPSHRVYPSASLLTAAGSLVWLLNRLFHVSRRCFLESRWFDVEKQ